MPAFFLIFSDTKDNSNYPDYRLVSPKEWLTFLILDVYLISYKYQIKDMWKEYCSSLNSPFPSCPKPLYQSEVWWKKPLHVKNSLICMWMKSRFEKEAISNLEMAYWWNDLYHFTFSNPEHYNKLFAFRWIHNLNASRH